MISFDGVFDQRFIEFDYFEDEYIDELIPNILRNHKKKVQEESSVIH